MKRISTATSVPGKFGPGKNGFTDGSLVGGVPATDLQADWFDGMQEEVANVIEDLGIVLDGNSKVQLLAALRGRFLGIQRITATSTYVPSKGAKFGLAYVQGGGGAGGGCPAVTGSQVAAGSGGTSGALAVGTFTITGPIVCTIGAGGSVNVGAPGGGGGASSLGAIMTAPGGPGGNTGGPTAAPYFTSGSGGSGASGGNLSNGSGQVGGLSDSRIAGSTTAGAGGGSMFGGGGGATGGKSNGVAASSFNFGAGGGGTANDSGNGATAGGAGAPGVIIIYEFA